MNNYTVSDTIIRVKNAAQAGRRKTEMPFSKMAQNILSVLKKEGYITDFKADKNKSNLTVEIAYIDRMPAINEVKIVSRPSIRVYEDKKGLEHKRYKGLKNLVLSTNKGIMTGKEAVEKGLGGEILFEVW